MRIVVLKDSDLTDHYKQSLYDRDKLLYVLTDDTKYLELFSKNFILNYISSMSTLDSWEDYINNHSTEHSVFLLVTADSVLIRHLKSKFKCTKLHVL